MGIFRIYINRDVWCVQFRAEHSSHWTEENKSQNGRPMLELWVCSSAVPVGWWWDQFLIRRVSHNTRLIQAGGHHLGDFSLALSKCALSFPTFLWKEKENTIQEEMDTPHQGQWAQLQAPEYVFCVVGRKHQTSSRSGLGDGQGRRPSSYIVRFFPPSWKHTVAEIGKKQSAR